MDLLRISRDFGLLVPEMFDEVVDEESLSPESLPSIATAVNTADVASLPVAARMSVPPF